MDVGDNGVSESFVRAPDNKGLAKQQKTLFPDFNLSLRLNSPFVSVALVEQATVPFRQVYEICRVAQLSKVDISNFAIHLKIREDDYSSLWSSLCKIVKACGRSPPERSSSIAWVKAERNFQGVSLGAELGFRELPHDPIFDLKLLPMKTERSYRLSRRYGSDRFLVLTIPGLGPESLPRHLKDHAASFCEAFVNWMVKSKHNLLGRTWKAFFVKPESKKKKRQSGRSSTNIKFRVYLFSEDGPGFWQTDPPTRLLGEVDDRRSWILDRQRHTVQQMVEWFMPFKSNEQQPSLKFFDRLSLGLSSTIATVTFKHWQIFRSDDAFAHSPGVRRLQVERSEEKKMDQNSSKRESSIMNDGCARISRLSARYIAANLHLDYIPSVFQGRIGGAKGVWIVDSLNEIPNRNDNDDALWIEITDSQLKFNAQGIDLINPDPDRVTFEVISWSKELASTKLYYQLIPILQDRGVPAHVFKTLLEQDLSKKIGELEEAMNDALALRKWNQCNNSTKSERLRYGGVQMCGGLPESEAEKINWFVDHGFEPKQCQHLKGLLFKIISRYCRKLEDRMNIGLDLSTVAFMIADPLNVLAENEVHIGFSGSFKDKDGFDQMMLHGVDVLVARLPAHLPSDIQKVRAVFKPELRMYQNVVIFSCRGEVSLASKLSGGDYDGDKAWMCWEPNIVKPFQNVSVPRDPSLKTYGIEKDATTVSQFLDTPVDYMDRFLTHAFDFNLRSSMLGRCTVFHEAMCYAKGNLNSPDAISIALLLGLLVDSAKQGYKFGEPDWNSFLKKQKLPTRYDKPAYKDKGGLKPKDNLIDDLVFKVAPRFREDALSKFHKHFQNSTTWDDDLIQLHNQEREEAISDKSLDRALKDFMSAFDKIIDYWKRNARPEDDNDNFISRFAKRKERNGPSYNDLVQECRKDFLSIPPCVDEIALSQASSLVRRWAKEHCEGRPSHWNLVKASVAFHKYHQSNFIWYIAGVELGELKATANGRGTYHPVVNDVYTTLKPDIGLIDGMRKKDDEEDETQKVADEEGDDDFEDEDDFGEWIWEDAFDC